MSTLLTSHDLAMRTFNCMRKHSFCQKFLKSDLFAAVHKSFASLHFVRAYLKEHEGYITPGSSQKFVESLAAEEPALKRIFDLRP